MGNNKLVTLQIDIDTRERLEEIAKANQRSMTGQARWMVRQEWIRLFGDPDEKIVDIDEPPKPLGAASVSVVTLRESQPRTS